MNEKNSQETLELQEFCIASNTILAKEMNCHPKEIPALLKELEDHGLIKIKNQSKSKARRIYLTNKYLF